MKWFGASAGCAATRDHLQKACRVAILIVMALAMLGLPATSAPTSANSFSDQIAAARARSTGLKQAIDQQNRLLGNLQGDAAAARAALARTSSQLDGINADQAQVKQEVKAASAALAKVQARRAALQDQLGQLDMTLNLLEQEIQQGSDELDARRSALGARLADAYRSQGTSLLEQVLSSGSFTDVVSDASAYLAYGDQDAQEAEAITQDQASLDSLRGVTAATRYRTDVLRQAQQDAATDLKAQKAVLAEAKAKLRKLEQRTKAIQAKQLVKAHKIAATQKQARAYIRRQQAARRKLDQHVKGLLAAAQREASRNSARSGGGTVSGNGRFLWPTSGTVTQEFGCTGFYLEPPRGSCAHFHTGIDIANGSGTPIHAAGDGVVVFSGWGTDGSLAVLIAHGGGFSTFYGHMSRILVRQGQRVHRGQTIGLMGATGNATGPHLHFEVDRGPNLTPVNPRLYT